MSNPPTKKTPGVADSTSVRLDGRGLSDVVALADRKAAWADACRHTPHGQPVELAHR